MKKSEVKHILTSGVPEEEKQLEFIYYAKDNVFYAASMQPKDWDNVRHIADDYYYAWNDKDETNGGVYIGKFV